METLVHGSVGWCWDSDQERRMAGSGEKDGSVKCPTSENGIYIYIYVIRNLNLNPLIIRSKECRVFMSCATFSEHVTHFPVPKKHARGG